MTMLNAAAAAKTVSGNELIFAFALLSLPAAPAFARSEKTLAYLRDQAWPAAVLAIAMRLPAVEFRPSALAARPTSR